MTTWPKPLPLWIDHAFRHIGMKEIPGPKHNPAILQWIRKLKGWFTDDETPWCGTFVAHCLQEAGLSIPKNWFRAKEYSSYGTACSKSAIPFGAIGVKSRVGGGHVFFIVAQSRDGQTVYGLGGNQRNMVNITSFKLSELDAVRWPDPSLKQLALPIADNSAALNAQASGGSEA